MAKLVPAKCPSCGATIVVDPDLEACTCEYCGNAFIVQKAVNNYITNNTTNIYNKKQDNEYSVEVEKHKSQTSQVAGMVAIAITTTVLVAVIFLSIIVLEMFR